MLVLISSEAGAKVPTIGSELERSRTMFNAADFFLGLPGLHSSREKCLARGFSTAVCDRAHVMCGINHAAGTFYGNIATLLDVFQLDCGNGICFACCFTGQRCHTSFYSEDYRPVINCAPGPGYGPIAFQAGPTVIVDPDAQPGDACLFTGQTCDHLPLCVSGKSAQDIERINNDPGHIMKSAAAVNSRARTFATATLGNWSRFLSNYHTSFTAQSDSIRATVHDFTALGSFVTGRGCVGWRQQFPASFVKDWTDPMFRLENEDGDYAEEASHYNGIRQLGVARLLAGIPNLYNRLAYVESRIWTPQAIEQYLAGIGNPDEVLLRTMSPLALEILKNNRQLQDYRLLAVPLAGETVPVRFYQGCTLGNPPAVQMTHRQRSTHGIDVTLTSSPGVDALIAWGDGSVARVMVPSNGIAQTAHDYAAGGKYQVIAVAQNDTGLRTIAALVADTSSKAAAPANVSTPVVSEVQLVDLRATLDSFAGNAMTMLFELEGWPDAIQGYALGISRVLRMPLEESVRFGTIAGWNTGALPLRTVTIRPTRWGEGILLGFRRIYFTLDRLRLGVYSTEHNRLRYVDVAVTPEMVRLYPRGSSTPVTLTQPQFGADGRLQIPTQVGSTIYSRVDLVLPASFFQNARQKPVTDPAWDGFIGTLPELVPDDAAHLPLRRRATSH